jgi:conjugal transfer mating pair stabilization protein TraG
VYEVYAYWNVQQLVAIFNGIVAIMGQDDFVGLLRAIAVLGLIIAAIAAIIRMRGDDVGTWIVFLAVFYFALFVPKVTVAIVDRTASNPPQAVANVPLGVAFFASATSHVGDWLTRSFETVFSLPSEVRFQGGGLLFGSRVVQEMRRAAIDQPVLQRDMVQFVKECVVPELINRTLDIDLLVRSTTIWGDIGAPGVMNPGRFVSYDLGASVDTCPNVYGVLDARINAATAREQTRLGRLLNPHEPNPVNASALVAAQLPVVTNLLLGASSAASDTIRQNMMINLLRDSSVAIPQLLADPAAVQAALAQAQAEVTAESAFIAMAKMAESALPKIRNVVEILVIAVFPVILLLIVAAGSKAGLIIRSYVMAFVWVQLWAPLYAVLNYVATLESSSNAQAAAEGIAGFTLSTTAVIGSTLISDQAVAGMMTLAIPVIATMIVTGGAQALTSMTSTVMSPAQSSAQAAGAAAGAGNVGFANASWDTASWANNNANQWSQAHRTTPASMHSWSDVAGTWETGAGGYGPVYTTNQGRGVVTPQMMASVGQEWSRQADRSWQIGQTQSLQAQESWRSAFQNATSYMQDNASLSRATGGYTWQDGTRMTTQQQAIARSLNTIANDLGITDISTASRIYEASLGVGTPKAIRLAGGVSVRSASDEQISDTVRKVQQVSRDAGVTDERAVVHAAMAGGGFEMGGQASKRGASDLRASYDSAIAYERQAQSSFSEAHALRNAATAVSREGFSITGDDTYAMHTRAAQEGVSRSAMNDPAIMMDVARRYFLEKYGTAVGGSLQALDPNAPPPSADQMPAPRFTGGAIASPEAVGSEASRARGAVSSLNRGDGVPEHGAPSMHDAAEHFIDTKRRAHADIGARERRVAEDEQALQDERSRRYDQKSIFNDANPGRKPDQDSPLTTQWDFYRGGEERPNQRP